MVGLNFVIPFSKAIRRENVFLSCLASEGVGSLLSTGNAPLFGHEAVRLNAAFLRLSRGVYFVAQMPVSR